MLRPFPFASFDSSPSSCLWVYRSQDEWPLSRGGREWNDTGTVDRDGSGDEQAARSSDLKFTQASLTSVPASPAHSVHAPSCGNVRWARPCLRRVERLRGRVNHWCRHLVSLESAWRRGASAVPLRCRGSLNARSRCGQSGCAPVASPCHTIFIGASYWRPFTATARRNLSAVLAGTTHVALVAALAVVLHAPGTATDTFVVERLTRAATLPLLTFSAVVIVTTRGIDRATRGHLLIVVMALSAWVTVSAAQAPTDQSSFATLETLCLIAAVLATLAAIRRTLAARHASGAPDTLTGLLTRQRLHQEMHTLTYASPIPLAVINLNGLQSINDILGHHEGDRYIQRVTHTLRNTLPRSSLLARWGGDEFVALLPGGTLDQLQDALGTAARHVTHPLPDVTPFTYGVASVDAPAAFERAYVLADQHLNDQKLTLADASAHTGDRAWHDVSRQLELLETPDEIRQVGLHLVTHLLRFDAHFHLERHGTTIRLAGSDGIPTTSLGCLTHPASVTRGLAARCFQRGLTVYTADYPAQPDAVPDWVNAGVKSLIMTPVRCQGVVVGVIAVVNLHAWRSITPRMRRILETLALRLGHALDLERVAANVRGALEGGLLGLGAALEARDLETSGHTERVVQLSTRLAEYLGVRGAQLDAVRQGAYLHDIGKLAIPDAVLLKPGPLSEPERAVIRTHAERGYDMARRIPTLSAGALALIRHHHERWDGSGYPDGLAGTSIPLLARIFSVVDVYDALTHRRPYKHAWPPRLPWRRSRGTLGSTSIRVSWRPLSR